jgi:heat shock protein HtpX
VPVIDARARRRYKIRNAAQAVLLLGGMVVLLAALAWLLFGLSGLLIVLVFGALVGATRPEVPSGWVLSAYGARPLPQAAAPQLHHYVRVLAERAGLSAVPALYYVASPTANAFAVGRRDDAALAVTDGLLRLLGAREVVGVLAHEVGHIRADDVWVMNLSDTLGRITHGLAYFGVLLLLLTLPMTTEGTFSPLWFAVILTVLPTVVTLLQLGLSRSREYDADLEAVSLTGDPNGLASALEQLERSEGRIWERVMVPRRRAPDPLLLRTHPPTAERTRRLRALAGRDGRKQLGDDRRIPPANYPPVQPPTRLRFPGVRW